MVRGKPDRGAIGASMLSKGPWAVEAERAPAGESGAPKVRPKERGHRNIEDEGAVVGPATEVPANQKLKPAVGKLQLLVKQTTLNDKATAKLNDDR